jgi:hypothetical protein
MAVNKLKKKFEKRAENTPPKKRNILNVDELHGLRRHTKIHAHWLRIVYFPRLAISAAKIDLEAIRDERGRLEAIIHVSVASIVAHAAHKGQLLKADKKPYIEHPRHLASKLRDPWDKIIALLHDVLENSNLTAEFLRDELGFPEDVVADIKLLNHDKKRTPYLDYVRNLGQSLRAGRIKIEDLKHNMDPKRTIPGIRKENDMYKRECYEIALAYLRALQDGKIEPGSSIVEFLTTHSGDYLFAEREDMKSLSPDKKVQYRAEQLYVARRALMYMSTEYGAIQNLWDPAIKNLMREKRVPLPQSPAITTPFMALS